MTTSKLNERWERREGERRDETGLQGIVWRVNPINEHTIQTITRKESVACCGRGLGALITPTNARTQTTQAYNFGRSDLWQCLEESVGL